MSKRIKSLMVIKPLFVNVHEAAVILGLSVGTVHNYIKAKKIPAVKLGHRVLVPIAGLESLTKGVK